MISDLNHIRTRSLFCAILIFFNSCRVYHSEPVSLQQAVSEKKRTKIKTKQGKTLKFKEIIKEHHQFFGLTGKNKIPLQKQDIISVRLHNTVMSPILTIVTLLVTGGTIALFIVFSEVSESAAALTPP